MTTALYIAILLLVFVLGAFVGGFLIRAISYLQHQSASLLTSSCVTCGHELRTSETIPVLSFLVCKGRCRYCNERIPLRHLVIEVLTGLLALLSYLAFLPPGGFLVVHTTGSNFLIDSSAGELGLVAAWMPLEIPSVLAAGLSALLVFSLFCLLVVVTCVDADTMEIPNMLSVLIALLGVLSLVVGPTASLAWYDHLIGAVCVSLPLLLLALVFAGSFGLGDVKLMAAAGLFLGWQLALLAAVFGVFLGGAYGIYVLATKRLGRKEHFAFGPALCAGIALSLCIGQPLIAWYTGAAF